MMTIERSPTLPAAPEPSPGWSVLTAPIRIIHRAAAFVFALGTVSACVSVGPDYRAPELGETIAASRPVTDEPTLFWWREVGDPLLSELIEEGLAKSNDLEAAAARVRQARAIFRETRTQKLPALDATGRADAQRQAPAEFGFPGIPTDIDTPVSVGLATTWELDLFGRIDRLTENAVAAAEAAEAARLDLARVIAGDIALAYTDYREAERRLAIAGRNLENQRRTLALTMDREDTGRSSQLDVARAKAQVALTRATLPQLRVLSVGARNRLTTLLALAPGGLDDRLAEGKAEFPALPDVVLTGSPAGLIQRRPDIRSAERSLAAATARIGVSTADLFPRITVSGSVNYSALEPEDMFTPDAFNFGVGPRITWSLFDRRAIYARIEQADASAVEALAVYRQTVIVALEEVDTALAAYNEEALRVSSLTAAESSSATAEELSRVRYEVGREPLLTVLDAERVRLNAEDTLASSKAERIRAQIRLYRALAGGWPAAGTDQFPDLAQVADQQGKEAQ